MSVDRAEFRKVKIKMKNIVSEIIIIIMSILSILTGCFSNKPDTGSATDEVTPISLPDGTHISRLFVHRSGSMMEMCYILCEKEDGVYMKRTFDEPYYRDGADGLPDRDRYVYGVCEIFEDEWRAESVKLADDAPLREIEKVIEKYGALGWDGWKKENKLPSGVMDGDYHVTLYIELSDGTAVNMSGSNASPPKYSSFHYEIEKIFTKTADSLQNGDDTAENARCDRFDLAYKKGDVDICLTMTGSTLIARISDPDGKIAEKGARLDIRLDDENERPYEAFAEIVEKHGVTQWQKSDKPVNYMTDFFKLSLSFEDGAYFSLETNNFPDGLDGFLKDIAEEMLKTF